MHICREFVAITMTELIWKVVAVLKMVISDFQLIMAHRYLLYEQNSDTSFCCLYVLGELTNRHIEGKLMKTLPMTGTLVHT